MKFQYNPLSAEPLIAAPADDNITFDLPSKHIYVKGVDFVGTDTTYNVFKKPTSSSSGEVGLVPVPTYTTTADRFLCEDGTWVIPPDTNYYRPIKVDGTSILGNNNTALNLVAGDNILLTPEMSGNSYTGKVTITNSGVRSISTGTLDGTISVNTAGTTTNIPVKGLGSAAYTESGIYATKQTLTNSNLNTITFPGFYNAGGDNTCTNTPFATNTAFGLMVIKTASGEYYQQIIYQYNSNKSYRRYCSNGTWSDWEQENWNSLEYNIVTSSTDGLVPKFDAVDGTIDSNTSDWVLTNNNGSIGWYKLPTNSFYNNKVENTANNTTKAYLLGATTQNDTNTTITDSGVYLGTEAGHLYATVYHGALGDDVTTDTLEQNDSVTDNHIASVGYVNQAIDDLINGAPGTMDTLKEISDYLQGSVSGGVVESLANKLNRDGSNSMTAGSEITWESQNSKVARIGQYSTDGSMLISVDGNTTASGLVLGGTSGNLLWKGNRIADADNTNYTPTITSSTTNSYKIGDLSIAGETFSLYGKDNNTNKVNTGTSGKLAYYSGTDAISSYTSTKGAYNLPVYLNAGVPTAVSSIGEAYLSWGGKNLASSYGPLDAVLVDSLGANRFDCLPADCVTVEYSRDGGTTWLDYEPQNESKVNLISQTATNAVFVVGKSNSTNGVPDVNSKLRITISSVSNNISRLYTYLNKFVIYCSTSGSQGCNCTIKYRTQENYENNIDTWATVAENVSIGGWSGYNVINTSVFATYGNTPATQAREIMFEFGITSHSNSNYYGLNIWKIFAYGGVGWTTPSNMAARGHLYKYDAQQNATFPAAITATKFIKSGGTSAQFLKADGSVDTNSYVKTSDVLGLFTDLTSTSNTNLSMSIGGTTKSITDLWARRLAVSPTTITSTTDDTVANWAALGTSIHGYLTTGQLTDQPSQYGLLLNVTRGTDWSHQIWMTQASGSLYHRGGNASGWSGTWRTLLDSSNYTDHINTTNFPGLYKTGTVTSVTLTSGTGITVSNSGTAITTSGTRTISLNAASSSAIGGIQLGYTASGANIPLQTSSNKGYVTLTKDAIVKALGYTPPTSDTTYSAGTGISLSGTTFSNAGVRSTTINGNYLRVNTNGTNDDLTIPYATVSNELNRTAATDVNSCYSDLKVKYFTLAGCSATEDTGNKRFAGTDNSYGFPVSNNANGLLWLGSHSTNYGHQLGFSSDGRIYDRYISAGSFATTANGGSWKKLAFVSDIPTNLSDLTDDLTRVTSITPGIGLTGTSSDVAITSTGTINLKPATSSEIGGIQIGYSQNGKNYPVLLDANNNAYVNVPWEDTKTGVTGSTTNVLKFYENNTQKLSWDGTWEAAVDFNNGNGINISSSVTNGGVLDYTIALDDSYIQTLTQEFISGTQTAATSAWKGNSLDDALYDGKCIIYWLPYSSTSTAVTLDLTLSNGSSTGAINVYYGGTTRITTHYGAGNAIRLIYRENVSINGTGSYTGWWADANYIDGNTYGIRNTQAVKAASAITSGNIIVGDSSGYHHLKTGGAFDVTYPIYYAASNISSGSTGTNNYASHTLTITTTQATTFTAYKAVYLKGTISGTVFTPVSTTPLTQTVPTREDGYVYMLIGVSTSTTTMFLQPDHPLYMYKNGQFVGWIGYAQQGNPITFNDYSGSSDICHVVFRAIVGTEGETAAYDTAFTYQPSTDTLSVGTLSSNNLNASVLNLSYDDYSHTIQGDSDGMLIIEGSEGIILDNDVTCNYSITLTSGLYALSTATSSTYGLGTSGQVLTSNGSGVYWNTLNYITADDLTEYAKKTDLSEFITASALEYYATTNYVDQKVAGITGGTTVTWGTTSNNTSPLTVAGTTKTVSLSGHTHSYAPISHASSATTYGVATTANYGHVKISNGDCNTVASANGLAAGMDHTHGNYATTTALASYLPLAGGSLTGAVTSSSTITATAFYQSSDRNLKDNIQLLQQDILDKIYNTNEVTFTWKNTGERAYGYIAQDMQSISEDLVRVTDNGHLVLDYNSVLVLQVAALKQKIENLEERIQVLERSLN